MDSIKYREIGALLIAVGNVMILRGLCAEATQDGNSDDELVGFMMMRGIEEERAREIIRLDLKHAVSFIEEAEAIEMALRLTPPVRKQ
jgi:hypothetical protein